MHHNFISQISWKEVQAAGNVGSPRGTGLVQNINKQLSWLTALSFKYLQVTAQQL